MLIVDLLFSLPFGTASSELFIRIPSKLVEKRANGTIYSYRPLWLHQLETLA